MKDLISLTHLQKKDLLDYINYAEKIEKIPRQEKYSLLKGQVLMSLFFEPSTRTKLSFDAAMVGLGGQVLGFAQANTSSHAKGESLVDTIRTVQYYSDIIVMRHYLEGAAQLASQSTSLPVINAGDGANQHPTQTLLDLLTLKKLYGKLENFTITLAGDLKFSRTVHSLFQALSHFEGIQFRLASPKELSMPPHIIQAAEKLTNKKLNYIITNDLQEGLQGSQFVYMTRVQKERFPDPEDYEKVKSLFVLTKQMILENEPEIRVLHPLPRVEEIHTDVDDMINAQYFPQVHNGVIMRQGLLCKLLGVKL